MGELSEEWGVHLSVDIVLKPDGKTSQALQRLFSEEAQEEDVATNESLAKQVVDSLLSAGLGAFPDQLDSLGLSISIGEIEHMTPYELAVAVFERWSSEQELFEELDNHIQSDLSVSMRNLIRFCIQAMLHKLNVIINPKYKGLFVEDGRT